jgi:hypothetical protein
VIVRILGEGQYTLDDAHADVLNSLDAGLESAVASDDEQAFRTTLVDLLNKVRTLGTPTPEDTLEPSDAVLPAEDSSISDVRELLSATGEGLIPG